MMMKVSMSIPPENEKRFFEVCKEKIFPKIMKKTRILKTPPNNFEQKKRKSKTFFMIELEIKDLEKIPFYF